MTVTLSTAFTTAPHGGGVCEVQQEVNISVLAANAPSTVPKDTSDATPSRDDHSRSNLLPGSCWSHRWVCKFWATTLWSGSILPMSPLSMGKNSLSRARQPVAPLIGVSGVICSTGNKADTRSDSSQLSGNCHSLLHSHFPTLSDSNPDKQRTPWTTDWTPPQT